MPRKRDAALVVAGIHGLGHLDGGDLAIGRGPDVVLRGGYRLNDRADAFGAATGKSVFFVVGYYRKNSIYDRKPMVLHHYPDP